jgi:hypothetical protein
LGGAAGRDLAYIDCDDLTAGTLDAVDELGLRREVAEQPIEIGRCDDVGGGALDGCDCLAQARRSSSALPPLTSSSS